MSNRRPPLEIDDQVRRIEAEINRKNESGNWYAVRIGKYIARFERGLDGWHFHDVEQTGP